MSLQRRLEMVFGGPARPFDLTVADADLLASACGAYLESRHTHRLPQESPEDYQSDSETDAHIVALQRRLHEFAGYRHWPR